jgi:hypothetical protein
VLVHHPKSEQKVMPRRPYPRWQRRHEAILRLMMEKPHLMRSQIASATGYSRWQVSRIMNAPDFRTRYRELRAVIDRELASQYMERLSSANGR